MAQYLVLVDGGARGWRVDRDALTAAIRSRWPDAEADAAHRGEARSGCWRFETGKGPGEAYLHQDGTCLYLDVRHEDAVRLATTFRRLAPADLDLIFCDEGYTFDVRLGPEATDAELTALMNDA
ncbi:hypothetical protein OHT61_05920 [Streptomyces sp. NBC_00178]|uniref:hypothetical protein n=1 Tax=Streptomyces sp. NBC_00178 TaxID=2975672 RepID=UPI002E29CA96|nr:hypothetical protein [Streptomyces sp. NBC_00178]